MTDWTNDNTDCDADLLARFDQENGLRPGDVLDPSLFEHVPGGWNDGTEPDPTLSFDALFGSDGEDDDDPFPESCRTDPLGEAAAELALAQKRLDAHFARFLSALTDDEVDRLLPRDQEVVRAFRALPEREQEALRSRFADPRFGVSHLLHAGAPPTLRLCEPPARTPYDPHDPEPVVATNKRTGRTTTASELARDWQEVLAGNFERVSPVQLRAEALRRIARKNLGTVVTMERMLDDYRAVRDSEPSSLRAVEPSSLRADAPPDNAARPLQEWSRDPVGIETATERSCRWCRETVEDEFDHDFCEPRGPDELATHPELGGDLRAAVLRWKESITCASCDTPVPFELVAPVAALEGATASAQTRLCPCGTSISLAYSWKQQRVVGLRMTPRRRREL